MWVFTAGQEDTGYFHVI
uniref:Uncharacterized protein n=1 Tax=Arundo donax TaxID=35708 RepID=A0A0A8ZSZ1_ARUDO